MADRPRFGPAGVPPLFRMFKATLADVPKLLQKEGLDAFEYEAVRWGANPQLKREDAEKLGLEAAKNDVLLSLHGSYFINFCGEKAIIEASKKRLLACVTAAKWMKAYVVVFHSGFYGKRLKREAFATCVKALKGTVETMKSLGINNVKIGPETMGKRTQLGSLEEVINLCETVEQTQPVIDWSHLHARDRGRFGTVEDFRRVVDEIENRLGTEAIKNLHCHFAKVEFTSKGERRHHILDEKRYGPDFRMLAKVIAEYRLKPVIISESPILDLDAIRMRDLVRKELMN
ncbi:TIM barrel protein [Candidatus Bathyarchaeota archaeon]|nr:TIM barrel protein [Candidatus Bathyarchaeota archaeon]